MRFSSIAGEWNEADYARLIGTAERLADYGPVYTATEALTRAEVTQITLSTLGERVKKAYRKRAYWALVARSKEFVTQMNDHLHYIWNYYKQLGERSEQEQATFKAELIKPSGILDQADSTISKLKRYMKRKIKEVGAYNSEYAWSTKEQLEAGKRVAKEMQTAIDQLRAALI